MTTPTGHVFIAVSLDGFIARPDGAIDWLTGPGAPDYSGEDHGYERFIAGMDAVVMGSASWAAVRSMEPWPYPVPVTVLSTRLGPGDVPPGHRGRVAVSDAPPRDIMAALGAGGARHVYVDGGAVIRSFLSEGLIAGMTITTLPVLIGAGRPLFGPRPRDLRLIHAATRSFPSGLVQSTWRVPPG